MPWSVEISQCTDIKFETFSMLIVGRIAVTFEPAELAVGKRLHEADRRGEGREKE